MSLAIIDATAGDAGPAISARYPSRYATPIANVPLIGHVFNELAASGTEHARIVTTRHVHENLEQLLHVDTTRGIDVSYRDVPEQDGRITLLTEVDEALAREPVLVHPGDCLLGGQITAMWRRFRDGDVDSVLPAQATVDPAPGPTGRRASDTTLLLGPATRPLLKDLLAQTNGGDDLVERLLHSACRLAVCAEATEWRYSDSTDALLSANRMMLDELPEPTDNDRFGEDNQIHGRVSVSPSAFLSNCVLYGPISIADHAVLEDAFIGPYTAIGPGAALSGTEIDNAMVLSGAEIRHPGYRIEASIIGEGSRVVRSFALPKGLHLRLSPDSSVTLS